MANRLNVKLTQSPDGTYNATVAEFPQVRITGARSLDDMRIALETALTHVRTQAGEANPAVRLPKLVPGQVSKFDESAPGGTPSGA